MPTQLTPAAWLLEHDRTTLWVCPSYDKCRRVFAEARDVAARSGVDFTATLATGRWELRGFDGARLVIRTPAAARGYQAHRLILDDYETLTDDQRANLLPAVAFAQDAELYARFTYGSVVVIP